MTLPELDRTTFRESAQPFLTEAIRAADWPGLLLTYQWDGGDWRAGLAARQDTSSSLGDASDDRHRAAAESKIVTWGGLPPLQPEVLLRVLDSLKLLDRLAATGDPPQRAICAGRIAAVSKIDGMHAPSDWVIYDSRVARGLAMLVREQFGSAQIPAELCFPQPQGRTRFRPEGFPALGTKSRRDLRSCTQAGLPRRSPSASRHRVPPRAAGTHSHVEMALFMLRQATDGSSSRRVPVPLGSPVGRIDTRLIALRHEIERLSAARRALTDPGPGR